MKAATQITFGNGDYGVDVGTYGGKPAVYITPNQKRGPVGKRIPLEQQGELVRDTLLDGETVLIFPSMDHCRQVADALVGSPAYHPPDVTLTPMAIKLLKRGVSGSYIGLSDDMGQHMYEVSVLGNLKRDGLVEFAKGPFPPGPPSLTPMVITDAGRAALQSVQSN